MNEMFPVKQTENIEVWHMVGRDYRLVRCPPTIAELLSGHTFLCDDGRTAERVVLEAA